MRQSFPWKSVLTAAILLATISCAQEPAGDTIVFTGDIATDLRTVAAVVAEGPYQADWATMRNYPIPAWYQDVKFGIFIHWGVYAVPAFGNEWYPRRMYLNENNRRGNYFEHHLNTWGPQKQFGYKDFIPLFTAELFDADAWATLFRESGARYIVPVAEHHDGFPMYASAFTDWDASQMGPQRDIVGELSVAVRKQDMYFGVSSHRAFNWVYYQRDESFDTSDPENFGLYGRPHDFINTAKPWKNPWPVQDNAFMDDWLVRTSELVEKYQPDLFWFDFGIGPRWVESPDDNPFQDPLKKFTAYYYNRAAAWGKDVAINYKHHAYPEDVAVLDIERGMLGELRELYWQTDTSVMYNSWGYISEPDYRTVNSIVDDLVDIVSKNGCLLLNIGPAADGTIPVEQADLLRGVGAWLRINGEAIYGTRYWDRYGEGPTTFASGSFNERNREGFTAEDFRFTVKDGAVYAIMLDWPAYGEAAITSLGSEQYAGGIASVTLLGYSGDLEWSQSENALTIQLPDRKPGDHAYAFKIVAGG